MSERHPLPTSILLPALFYIRHHSRAVHNCQLPVQFGRERAILDLVVPSITPGGWAEGHICEEELWLKIRDARILRQASPASYLTAGLEFLALSIDAFVVVNVVLPAVLRLVLVREASIEACASHQHVSSFMLCL